VTVLATRREAMEELAKRRARAELLAFMRWCWWMPHEFVVGRHTRAICERLTRAVDDWQRGVSTHLLIAVPYRHGKTDIVSRAFPPFFLGRCSTWNPDIIMSSYGDGLVKAISRAAKQIVVSPRYQLLFPGVLPARGNNRAGEWGIEGSAGIVTAHGLHSSLTGRGGHLLILDDYCKNLAEARSETYRNATWEAFKNFYTRTNAPASIVIVCATPWHVDDVRGRILREMKEDPAFPRFEELTFPARNPGHWDYLFPEFRKPKWYDEQRAVLGKRAPALLDCDPVPDGGERFDVSRVVYHDTLDGWPKAREVRFWDLASSMKQRDKDDPDWTWGIRGHLATTGYGDAKVQHLWISHMVACRSEAPQRDAMICRVARQDGPGVAQHIEAFGAYKDAYTTLKNLLSGSSVVHKSHPPGDKSVRAAPLEVIFDAGNVHVLRQNTTPDIIDMWRNQFLAFPGGKHDDAVDATSGLYHSHASTGILL